MGINLAGFGIEPDGCKLPRSTIPKVYPLPPAVTVVPVILPALSTEIETLGGLLLEKVKKIPKVGQIVYHNNYKFIIEIVDKKRIKQVKLILPK